MTSISKRMKYGIVNGKKVEATKGATGVCQRCGSVVIAKCGDIRVHHWAHKGRRHCDPWWEETEWHRSWKNRFPDEWQEVVRRAPDGEKHIADVRTANDWVIEFQHSAIDPEERRSRNDFYGKLVWVVNGMRRKTDRIQFGKAIEQSTLVTQQPPIILIREAGDWRLLQEWAGSGVPVFFDFASPDTSEDWGLWCLFPGSTVHGAYVSRYSREHFVALHKSEDAKVADEFESLMKELGLLVRDHQKFLRSRRR